ncbi:peptidoglycan DD-metalloendopeptidase family protein [Ulvibacter antarcticus]|uniref:Putative secreted protein (Por secretion system target) n=1 Tax=Ulvibacter antarcticus TaxID=442714 RepID=A0A3L9Z2R0_9FLAO|nr:peptidoglycan DD-metalloendopeptidase family protein [Ulvibacter antarcticus]RMA66430.1 putative secreted protein (Por secretion system target) [Ulvibacter antarcticus]
MTSKIRIICTAISILIINISFAQNSFSEAYGGEVLIPRNSEPCLTETQRAHTKLLLDASVAQLELEGRLVPINTEGGHPLFDWPMAQASGFNYHNIWTLSNYVDHNPAFPNQISDYDCGTRSYDTSNGYNHRGFDIISWPFWWKQMDRNQAIAIAGADGQIIYKGDGNFDRNCSFNNNPWNAVYLQHSDGSRSWYLHLKSGSLTSKEVGDTVSRGEFLGVIGSSGSSTLPHLHFEVYDSGNSLIDPSNGPCNNINSDSWWVAQKPYYNTGINAVLTHTYFPNWETCPNSEITNESDQFDLGVDVYYGIYLSDQRAGTSVHLKITRPNNSIFQEWDYALVDDLNIAYWMWYYPADMEGQWTFEATYNGDTVSHSFNVGALGTPELALNDTKVYPNPVQDKLFIDSESFITQVSFRDVMGKTLFQMYNASQSIDEIDVSNLSGGIYFMTITSEANQSKTIKIIHY